jgi:tetratricopeptide (TPR) repeat protein
VVEHEPTQELLAAAAGKDAAAAKMVDLNPSGIPDDVRATFAPFVPSEMNVRQVSNVFKHRAALEQAGGGASSSAGAPRFALIVEDDALFVKSIPELIERVVAAAPADADIIMASLPSPPAPDGGIGFVELEKFFKSPPACDGYLVTPSAAAALAAALLPIRMPTPMQLHYTARSLGLRMYVSTHNLFVDGSKIGTAVSSIVVNNLLIWNQAYCKLMDALAENEKAASGASADVEAALAASKDAPFGGHPDAIALRARVLVSLGRIDEAKACYEEAMTAYEKGNAVFGISSGFLRGYMDMYRHLQASNADINTIEIDASTRK